MNYYFSAVGGGSGYTGPSVTYVSNGVQRSTVANSTVWCDANSVYSYGGVLGSSITSERWVSLTGTGSGRVTTSATIQNNYYNQYDVSVAYSILGAPGSEEAPPMFAGYSFGSAITVPVTQTIASYWLDAGSNYTVTKLLTGSNSTDRWISIQSNFGIINASTSKLFSYYHQFALNFSYAIVGGGLPPNLPAVNYTSLNNNASMRLSNSPSPVWINAGSIFNVSSAMAAHNSTERWAFSSESDTANAPGLVHIILYHQYQVSFTITIAGGGSPSTAPKVSAFAFGKPESLQTVNMTTVWLDAGSTYSLPKSLGTVATERWLTLSTPTGVVNSSQIISLSYHHQFLISLAYNVINGPDSTGGPVATVVIFGTTDSVKANQTAGQVWVDAGTPVALPSLLPGSTSVERWFTNSSITGTSSPALALNPTYDHQFMVSLSTNPQGIPVVLSQQTGWYDSGATLGVQPLPGRGWNFESWTGQGNGAYSGPLSTLLLTVTTPVTETANFYAALTIAAPGTGSVTYSFGNVTGSVGQGQSKIVFVPPGQILSVSANPFPVFYAFSEWNGTIGGGPNATTISQNPLTFSISSPSSLDVSFRINLLGVIIVVVVVVVAVASVFLFRRRNRPREAGDEYVSEEEEVYSANSTIDTMEGS